MITRKKRELLIKFHDNLCEACHRKFRTTDLVIHRIKRGGDYKDHRILKVLCRSCHNVYHGNEFK